MDMIKILSIEGFIEYYLHYQEVEDKMYQERFELRRAGKKRESKALHNEELNRLNEEFFFVIKKYALICSMSELEKALVSYPEDSKEHQAVEWIWEYKKKLHYDVNTLLNF